MLASGELGLIRDETLSNRLAAWPSYVAEWAEEEEAVFSFVRDQLFSYLSPRTSLKKVAPALASFPDGEPPPPIPVESSEPNSVSFLADSVEFENLVYIRARGTWYAMRDGETLRVQLSDILELIRQNLQQ